MRKQYLIETEEIDGETFWHHREAKQVEVLDIAEVSKELYVRTGISIASIPQNLPRSK